MHLYRSALCGPVLGGGVLYPDQLWVESGCQSSFHNAATAHPPTPTTLLYRSQQSDIILTPPPIKVHSHCPKAHARGRVFCEKQRVIRISFREGMSDRSIA